MKSDNIHSKRISIFIAYSLITLTIYELIAEAIEPYFTHIFYYHTSRFTAALLIIFTIPMFIMTRKIKLPYSEMGFNFKDWKAIVIESVIVSIVFCILMTLLLYLFINYVGIFKGIPFYRQYDHTSSVALILMPIIYVIFTALQAFLIHSTIQAALLNLLVIKYKSVISIIITVLVFANFHLDLGLSFALFVIPPTLTWCILFARHQSLLGVYISHSIIGFWGLFILSFVDVIKTLEIYLQVQ
ncbi:hypothetical protein L3V82_10770 [Thiotrichales bacterium 19S3-7]|nr:hypothetical protein [Thiotrichales bacterium 19S3-7]MCF6802640.1 hypothetical protein [Thiotrichales bacterium 19S3-11]